jgi:hypothetical protein
MGKSTGQPDPNTSKSTRVPQRIVLLAGDEHSAVKSVLAEYPGADLDKVNVNEEVPKFAAEHVGKCVAVEWQGMQGWKRFLWCRR